MNETRTCPKCQYGFNPFAMFDSEDFKDGIEGSIDFNCPNCEEPLNIGYGHILHYSTMIELVNEE